MGWLDEFLPGREPRTPRLADDFPAELRGGGPALLYTGPGSNGLEVLCCEAASRPTAASVRRAHRARTGNRASPVLIAVGYPADTTETREEIERLRREEAGLFERGGTRAGALSGEEYRQVLRQALEDSGLAADIDRLGWGSGSDMAALPPGRDPGYVFCARVADRERPLFRYVELASNGGGAGGGSGGSAAAGGGEGGSGGGSNYEGSEGGEPQVIDDTLACLDRAQPPGGPGTPRLLGEDAQRRAFDAWEVARAHIVESWNHNVDPANLQPDIAPALRRAAELVRSHPPPELTQDEIDRAVDALHAPYQERVVRSVRSALNADSEPAERAAAVLAVIGDLGLEPYSTPEPLPEITPDNVHLVCWQALTPTPP